MLASLLPGWQKILEPIMRENFFKKLISFLENERSEKNIFPSEENVFRIFKELDFPDVKVVILGQDPYHGPGQALGLSFAVPNDFFPKPPSLQNIFKEIYSDLGVVIPKGQSDLSGWVKQGVLLLNTVLTVEESTPLSHRNQGWEQFADGVITALNERVDPVVFILWGSHAQKFKTRINLNKHFIFESAHPSPLSAYRGFFGSRVFSRVNEILFQNNKKPIQWESVSD